MSTSDVLNSSEVFVQCVCYISLQIHKFGPKLQYLNCQTIDHIDKRFNPASQPPTSPQNYGLYYRVVAFRKFRFLMVKLLRKRYYKFKKSAKNHYIQTFHITIDQSMDLIELFNAPTLPQIVCILPYACYFLDYWIFKSENNHDTNKQYFEIWSTG